MRPVVNPFGWQRRAWVRCSVRASLTTIRTKPTRFTSDIKRERTPLFLVVRFFGSRSAKRSGSVRQSMTQRPDSGDSLTSLALNFLFLPPEPPPTPGSRREGSQGDEKAISCQQQQSARSPLRTRAVRTKSSTGCPVIATVNRLPKGTSGDDRGVRQTPRVEVIFGITPPSISAQIPFSFGHFGSTMEVFG